MSYALYRTERGTMCLPSSMAITTASLLFQRPSPGFNTHSIGTKLRGFVDPLLTNPGISTEAEIPQRYLSQVGLLIRRGGGPRNRRHSWFVGRAPCSGGWQKSRPGPSACPPESPRYRGTSPFQGEQGSAWSFDLGWP